MNLVYLQCDMLRYGLEWCGAAWCGVVRLGVEWYEIKLDVFTVSEEITLYIVVVYSN